MSIAAFALLSAIGSWAAWRSNPLYSGRATLRFIFIVTLAVGAVIAAVIAAANLTANAPASISLPSLFAAVLIGTLALIAVVVQLSLPRVPALDRSKELVNVHRAALLAWLGKFGWTMLAFGILALALPGDGKFLVGVFGGMTAYLGIIMLFAGYLAALHADRSLTAVEAHPWVHWTYTSEQWTAWTNVEVERLGAATRTWNWSSDGKRLALPLLGIGAAMFIVDSWFVPLGWLTAFVAFTWALIIGLISAANLGAKAAPGRLRRLLLRAAPEAFIGAAGVFANGTYTEWQTTANWLVEATIDDRPPRSLCFRFARIVAGAGGVVDVRQNVLVPDGSDADIARIQAALATAYPEASILLSAQPHSVA